MKLKIRRKKILNALNNVYKVIDTNNIINHLKGVNFAIDKEKIILSASNGTMFIKEFILINENNLLSDEIGSFLIKPNYFMNILKKINEEYIELTFNKEKNELIIKANKLVMTLNTIDNNEFPNINIENVGHKIKMPLKDLKNYINEVIFASDIENKRIMLNAMNFNINNQKIESVATDSYRLAYSDLLLQNNNLDFKFKFSLLTKVVKDIIRILSDDKGTVILYISIDSIVINYNALSLKVRILQGNYPNVISLIPENFETELIIETKQLVFVMNKMEIFTVNNISSVNLEINKDKIIVKNNQKEIGTIEDIITDFKFSGKAININFNLRFLKEAVRAFNTKTISIKLISNLKPALITSTEKPWLKQLILPLRTF